MLVVVSCVAAEKLQRLALVGLERSCGTGEVTCYRLQVVRGASFTSSDARAVNLSSEWGSAFKAAECLKWRSAC